MRKLASVRRIDEIVPIPDADAIECARIGGWPVVVKKNEYKPGDLVVYLEIDSFVPHDVAPFLSKPGIPPKEYMGVTGERLRTVKLRGQISQGLILPLGIPDLYGLELAEGDDITEKLNIIKYEPPIAAHLQGAVRGNFPSFLRKTDQERVQNLKSDLEKFINNTFEISEKLDGSSMTVYHHEEQFGVCSRNLDLLESDLNTYWRVAKKLDLPHKLGNNTGFAVQGELIGEGIQGNPYSIQGHMFCVFNVFDIKTQTYLTPKEARVVSKMLDLSYVPVLETSATISDFSDIDSLLKYAEGKAIFNLKTEREGLVFKSNQSEFSFKAISNRFLIKEKE